MQMFDPILCMYFSSYSYISVLQIIIAYKYVFNKRIFYIFAHNVIKFNLTIMNEKLLNFLNDKCKDMGLTDKAITELAQLGSDGLTESSDEGIEAKANSLLPLAKAMQAEATRWAQKTQTGQNNDPNAGRNNGGRGSNIEEPDWFKAYKKAEAEKLEEQAKKMEALIQENNTFKVNQAKEKRGADIAAEAKRLGIPNYLMKRVSISDDADYIKELTEYKQELVTNKLMPADAAGVQTSGEQASKEIANDLLGKIEVK